MTPLQLNKNEILWNLINASLAGGLVFIGSLTSGDISLASCLTALLASLVVIVTKFKNYWETQEKEYISVPHITNNLFSFL